MKPSKVYKFTDQNNCTFNQSVWIPGTWKQTSGEGELCGLGWLHAYSDPLIAVFMNHTNLNLKLWLAEGAGKFKDDSGLKCGFTKLRILKNIKLPEISDEKRIEIALHCVVMAEMGDKEFRNWATKWVTEKDRSPEAARVLACKTRLKIEGARVLKDITPQLMYNVTYAASLKGFSASVPLYTAKTVESVMKIKPFNFKKMLREFCKE